MSLARALAWFDRGGLPSEAGVRTDVRTDENADKRQPSLERFRDSPENALTSLSPEELC